MCTIPIANSTTAATTEKTKSLKNAFPGMRELDSMVGVISRNLRYVFLEYSLRRRREDRRQVLLTMEERGTKERKKTKFGHGRSRATAWEKSRNEPPLETNLGPVAFKRINVAEKRQIYCGRQSPRVTTNVCNLSEGLRDFRYRVD